MIKGSAIIQFGSGSVASWVGCSDAGNVGGMLLRTCSPGKIGRDLKRVDWKKVKNDPEVVIYFTNVESLDSVISDLKELRKYMTKSEEETNDATNANEGTTDGESEE